MCQAVLVSVIERTWNQNCMTTECQVMAPRNKSIFKTDFTENAGSGSMYFASWFGLLKL